MHFLCRFTDHQPYQRAPVGRTFDVISLLMQSWKVNSRSVTPVLYSYTRFVSPKSDIFHRCFTCSVNGFLFIAQCTVLTLLYTISSEETLVFDGEVSLEIVRHGKCSSEVECRVVDKVRKLSHGKGLILVGRRPCWENPMFTVNC